MDQEISPVECEEVQSWGDFCIQNHLCHLQSIMHAKILHRLVIVFDWLNRCFDSLWHFQLRELHHLSERCVALCVEK